jgi:hypothetical protein
VTGVEEIGRWCGAPGVRLRNRARQVASASLSHEPSAAARLKFPASGGGWRARQDSEPLATREASRGASRRLADVANSQKCELARPAGFEPAATGLEVTFCHSRVAMLGTAALHAPRVLSMNPGLDRLVEYPCAQTVSRAHRAAPHP